ncbi:unnamed protein product [marine sediment metagenome]|uniref:PIN domain-containing protein n=1 Tax=marine sediment metagenome TaxID=412755 RepID=X0X8T8_9ZZZZ
MKKYMLDTNICIYIINKKPVKILQRLQTKKLFDIAISSITLSELEYGVNKSLKIEQNKIALFQFLLPIEIISYNGTAARTYGKIRAQLEKKGQPIGAMDILIGAHALSLNSILVTNNEKEFRKIPELKIENWAVKV